MAKGNMTEREARIYGWCNRMNRCESLNELAYVWSEFIVRDYYTMRWKDIGILEDAHDELEDYFKARGDRFGMAVKPAFMR